MTSRIAAPLACTLLLLCASCADQGNFPSLALRPAEALYASGDPERVPVPAPDNPAIGPRVDALVEAGRAGNATFQTALAAARPLAGRAGAPGSDSWIAAQQAVSRVEAGRTETMRALADLDRFAIDQARQGPLSAADSQRLAAGTATLQVLAERQESELNALQGRGR